MSKAKSDKKHSAKLAVILCNGNLTNITSIVKFIKNSDYIICADGGTKLALRLNLVPNLIIGDYDSLSQALQNKLTQHKNIEWIKHPIDKDKTDSEFALEIAVKKGFTDIVIGGLLGDRLDHMLANLLLLARQYSKVNIQAIEGKTTIYIIKKNQLITAKKGDRISLIPIKGNCLGVTTQGLRFPLNNEVLHFTSTLGISNVAIASKVSISITHGALLVFHESIV